MKLVYNINGIKSFEDLMALVLEIRSETGLEPESLVTDGGDTVRFDFSDSEKLLQGKITDNDYIVRHSISQ